MAMKDYLPIFIEKVYSDIIKKPELCFEIIYKLYNSPLSRFL